MNRACEECGAPAQVKILVGYRAGEPHIRVLCGPCADRAQESDPSDDAPPLRPRLSRGSIVALAGAAIGICGLFSRLVHVGESAGFGHRQVLAAALGAGLVVIAALFRTEVLGILGTVLFAVAVLADSIGRRLPLSPNVVPSLEAAAGLALIVFGLTVRHKSAR